MQRNNVMPRCGRNEYLQFINLFVGRRFRCCCCFFPWKRQKTKCSSSASDLPWMEVFRLFIVEKITESRWRTAEVDLITFMQWTSRLTAKIHFLYSHHQYVRVWEPNGGKKCLTSSCMAWCLFSSDKNSANELLIWVIAQIFLHNSSFSIYIHSAASGFPRSPKNIFLCICLLLTDIKNAFRIVHGKLLIRSIWLAFVFRIVSVDSTLSMTSSAQPSKCRENC